MSAPPSGHATKRPIGPVLRSVRRIASRSVVGADFGAVAGKLPFPTVANSRFFRIFWIFPDLEFNVELLIRISGISAGKARGWARRELGRAPQTPSSTRNERRSRISPGAKTDPRSAPPKAAYRDPLHCLEGPQNVIDRSRSI